MTGNAKPVETHLDEVVPLVAVFLQSLGNC